MFEKRDCNYHDIINFMYIKRAFGITKDNIILAQPLVLYLVVISLTMAGLAQQGNKTAFMVFALANILLTTAFCAGWFYMVKKTIEHSKKEFEKSEEQSMASFALVKDFFPGVGEFFLPVTFLIIIYTTLFFAVMYLGYKFGLHALPHPHINWPEMMAAQTPEQMQKFVHSLSFTQIKILNLWMFYMGAVFFLFSFLTLFLYPAMIYDSKNPFIAFWINIKFVFKNFFGSLGLLIFLLALHMFLSALSLLFSLNVFLSIIFLVISFYFATYCLVLIFLYYDEKRKEA